MRIPFLPQRVPDFMVEQIGLADADVIARLHAERFPRPWSAAEFASLLDQAPVFGFTIRPAGGGAREPAGFVLARLAAGEGEILSVAVSRRWEGQGLGWLLMDAVLRTLHRERAEALFLEVDETNAAALRLYRRLGFFEVGRRPRYYDEGRAQPTAALVMRRDLG